MPYRANADLTMSVSFMRDVIPVFMQNCAVGGGTCHGEVGTLPFLGLPEGSIDPSMVHDQIVGVKSGEDPTMNFVTAGDPANSYLMHKVDGDACTLAAQCTTLYGMDIPPCGATMPFLSPKLPVATRDKVRAWIAQGAMND